MTKNARLGFGKRVRECRKRSGMTQEALARLIGKRKDTISNIERGLYSTAIDTALAIAQALGIGLAELLDPPEDDPRPLGEKREAVEKLLKIAQEQDLHTVEEIVALAEALVQLRS